MSLRLFPSIVALLLLNVQAASAQPAWEYLHGLQGGSATTLLRTDGGALFVAGEGSDVEFTWVYRWEHATQDVPGRWVRTPLHYSSEYTRAIALTDGGTLLAGTSTIGFATPSWQGTLHGVPANASTQPDAPTQERFYHALTSPVYALATRGATVLVGRRQGLLRSTDEARTWRDSSLAGLSVFALAYEGATVWAATSDGLRASEDDGIAWEPGAFADTSVTAFALAPPAAGGDSRAVCLIAEGVVHCRAQQARRFARLPGLPTAQAVSIALNAEGTLAVTDGFFVWTYAHAATDAAGAWQVHQALPAEARAVAWRGDTLVVATTWGTLEHRPERSVPVERWERTGLPQGTILAVTRGGADTLYASTSGGELWRIHEHDVPAGGAQGGARRTTWEHVAIGERLVAEYAALAHDSRGARLAAATWAGVHLSSDAGATWQQSALTEAVDRVVLGPGTLFAALTAPGVLMLGDAAGGVRVLPRRPSPSVYALAFTPGGRVLYGGQGAYRLSLDGALWERLQTPGCSASSCTVVSLRALEDALYVLTSAGLYRCLPEGDACAVVEGTYGADQVAAAPGGTLAYAAFDRIWVSERGGPWRALESGLPVLGIRPGETPPLVPIYALDIDASGRVVAAVDDWGLFRSTTALTTKAVEGLAVLPRASEIVVWPNPSHAEARVQVRIPAGAAPGSEVQVEVFDLLGRHVLSLNAQPHADGVYEAVLSAGAVAPGLYVLHARTLEATFTATFVRL